MSAVSAIRRTLWPLGRRGALLCALGMSWAAMVAANDAPSAVDSRYAPVLSGHTLRFPQDFGSHPQFRTEWWYVTGWLHSTDGEPLGFQVTFFRTKPDLAADNPSSFVAHQLLVAHCALSDARRGRLWHDQRIRRAGLGLAGAEENDTRVWIDDWHLQRSAPHYEARIDAEDFALHLQLLPTQAVLINGDAGVSRKGPEQHAASYYYSLPHMQVSGEVLRRGARTEVSGEAWFDHEWSSEYLDDQAAGWDWLGIDLADGAALMAFRIRGLQGETRWAGGTWRGADGTMQILAPQDVQFNPLRRWRSPRTGIDYPVEWQVHAGSHDYRLSPLLDDQENDTRLSTGAIYWEGAVRALEGTQVAGEGYLELTGYGERLRLR